MVWTARVITQRRCSIVLDGAVVDVDVDVGFDDDGIRGCGELIVLFQFQSDLKMIMMMDRKQQCQRYFIVP